MVEFQAAINFLTVRLLYLNFKEKAEENNHHPDVVVGWCKISLVFTSHDLGGVTQLCIKMAKEAEKIFSSIESSWSLNDNCANEWFNYISN